MEDFMDGLVAILVPLGPTVVLPLLVLWLIVRRKMHSDNTRKEIILAALEKDANIDIEELLRKMNKPEKLLKEKLLNKLHWGLLTTFLGLGFIGFATYLYLQELGGRHDQAISLLAGLVLVGIGVAFILNFYIGRKMLAREMEAEERNMQQ